MSDCEKTTQDTEENDSWLAWEHLKSFQKSLKRWLWKKMSGLDLLIIRCSHNLAPEQADDGWGCSIKKRKKKKGGK